MSPVDAGRAQHLQVTVTSTQISSKHPLKLAAVLQSVKGRQLHYTQRGINHCPNTATCSTSDLIFLLLRELCLTPQDSPIPFTNSSPQVVAILTPAPRPSSSQAHPGAPTRALTPVL